MAPPRPTGGGVRRLRRRLWHRQEKRCHWCGKSTILPEDLLRRYIPLDDLYDQGLADGISLLHQQLMMQDADFRAAWLHDLATLDHLIEHAQGGPFEESNLVVACSPCNQRRGTMFNRTFDPSQFEGLD